MVGAIAVATAVVLAAGGTTVVALATVGEGDVGGEGTPNVQFHTVDRRDLIDTTTAPGTLDFGDRRTLAGTLAGTITGLPGLGEVIDRGGVLYRVDDTPVVLLLGSLPIWRGFDVSMKPGADVLQLEENLSALGYFAGEPDTRFDWVTREAVRDFQEAYGMPRTGALEHGRIVFEPSARRIGELKTVLGGPATGEVFVHTGTERVVSVQLPVAEQRLAIVDAPVTLRLPGGADAGGKVMTVGAPTEITSGSDTKLVVPVQIRLDDPAAAGELQRITVSVDFQSAVYEDVLAVPLTALIALPGGGLGVERRTADGLERVPVETGAFVRGFVEIVGGDLDAGDDVVVPE